MTIRPGSSFGELGPLSPEGVVVDTDAAARAEWGTAHAEGRPLGEIGLLGGDLHRTLGARRTDEAGLRSGAGARFIIDLGVARLDDGPEVLFCAHLVLRPRRWFAGRTVAVMNAAFVEEWNLAPAAHPGDGRFDVLDGGLPWMDRRRARARLPLGTHVPHPGITVRRARELDLRLERPTMAYADGEPLGAVSKVTVRVLPDAAIVVA